MPTMISYAQNAEDVLLSRVLADVERGFYIDAGANDPVEDSVTKHFHDRGWRGINIEPDGAFFRRLQAERPDDVNRQAGLSDREGSLTFWVAEDGGGWSTFDPEHARELRRKGFRVVEREVPVTTLAALCETHVGDRTIDFLKVDVEGHEREAIAGGDWKRWRPRVVVVESNGREGWEPILREADYETAAFDGLNRYYVRAEEAAVLLPRFDAPVNVLDDYIPYRYHRRLKALEARTATFEAVGPRTLALARGLRRAADWVPGLATLARRR